MQQTFSDALKELGYTIETIPNLRGASYHGSYVIYDDKRKVFTIEGLPTGCGVMLLSGFCYQIPVEKLKSILQLFASYKLCSSFITMIGDNRTDILYTSVRQLFNKVATYSNAQHQYKDCQSLYHYEVVKP